jgi:hypothetical protein
MRTVSRRASKPHLRRPRGVAAGRRRGSPGRVGRGRWAASSWPSGSGRLPPPQATGTGFGAPCTGLQPCWPSGGEQVGEEVLEVVLGGVLEASAAAAEEHLGLVKALEVVLNRALRAVLGAKVPLERADQAAWGVVGHAPDRSAVMRRPSVMRPHEPAWTCRWPAFPLVIRHGVEVRGFEPLASSVRVRTRSPLCGPVFPQVASDRQG